MNKKTLMIKSIEVIICNIEKKHDLFFKNINSSTSLSMKFNFIKRFNENDFLKLIFAIKTFWNWYLRLKRYRSKMINQFKEIDKIEMIQENNFKIV
jgi:hypothetical protein